MQTFGLAHGLLEIFKCTYFFLGKQHAPTIVKSSIWERQQRLLCENRGSPWFAYWCVCPYGQFYFLVAFSRVATFRPEFHGELSRLFSLVSSLPLCQAHTLLPPNPSEHVDVVTWAVHVLLRTQRNLRGAGADFPSVQPTSWHMETNPKCVLSLGITSYWKDSLSWAPQQYWNLLLEDADAYKWALKMSKLWSDHWWFIVCPYLAIVPLGW